MYQEKTGCYAIGWYAIRPLKCLWMAPQCFGLVATCLENGYIKVFEAYSSVYFIRILCGLIFDQSQSIQDVARHISTFSLELCHVYICCYLELGSHMGISKP